MMYFLLPKMLCEDLEALIAKYWSQGGPGRRGIHWCSWEKVCGLKLDGGLGFQNIKKFNVALLAKQGWRLIDKPDSLLTCVLKAKYYFSTNFLKARLGNAPSYTWKSIWAARGLLKDMLG